MATRFNPQGGGIRDLRAMLIEKGFGGDPDFDKLGTRAEKLREYLGPTDYGSRLQESTDFAKLQAALALAQRGFAAMGAQPQRGESPIGTLGRTLASPLAGDLGKVASTLYQQRLAAKTAEEAEDRAVKLAAYTQAASRKKGLDAAVLSLLKDRGADYNYTFKPGVTATTKDGTEIPNANVIVGIHKRTGATVVKLAGQNKVGDTTFAPGTDVVSFTAAPKSGTGATGPKVYQLGLEFPDIDEGEMVDGLAYNSQDRFRLIKSGVNRGQYMQEGSGTVLPKNWPLAGLLEEVTTKASGKPYRSVGHLPGHYRKVTSVVGGKPVFGPGKYQLTRQTEDEVSTLYVTGTEDPIKLGTNVGEYQPVDTTTTGDKISVQAGPDVYKNDAKDVLLPTTRITIKDKPSLILADGSNTPVKFGTGNSQFTLWKKAGAPTKPTGLNTPEFKSVFSGMLAKLPDVRQRMELGKRGLKFDPAKYNINPDLKAGEDFPFSRQDGGEFLEKDQKTYLNKLKNAYFGLFKTTKTGADLVELDEAFIQSFLEADVKSLGLKDPPARADIPAAQITIPSAIQKRYVDLARELPTNPANEIIQKGPLPVGRKNLLSGFGKLVLFDKGVGVPFGPTTKSPASLSEGATPAEIEIRRKRIKSLNKLDIQRRLIAERISKGTTLASKLSPRLKFEQKIGVVSSALNAAEKKLNDALNEPKGKEIGETVGKSLETLAFIDGIDVKMKKSGLPGFVTGPIRAFGIRKLDTDPGAWFQSDAGKEATREFLANMPILEELVSRDLLKAAGEQRISDRDLKGIQGTLIKINQTGEINARQLRALRGYLKNSVKHSLEYVGSYGLPERVLEQAATLGIDVKSIEGRNGFYSPYLKDQKYAVTGKDVPSYSKAYQKQLRDSRIFGYSAIRPESGGTTQYELLKVDGNGNPIWDNSSKKYKTVLVPATKGWQTRVPGGAAVLNFNRNFLLKTYNLGR